MIAVLSGCTRAHSRSMSPKAISPNGFSSVRGTDAGQFRNCRAATSARYALSSIIRDAPLYLLLWRQRGADLFADIVQRGQFPAQFGDTRRLCRRNAPHRLGKEFLLQLRVRQLPRQAATALHDVRGSRAAVLEDDSGLRLLPRQRRIGDNLDAP